MTFPMTVGATTVLNAERPTPDGVAALLRKHPVTVFYAVPTFYAAFLASPNAPQKSRSEDSPLHFRRRGIARRNCASDGRNATASKSPTGSVRPRCCTSISPTAPGATKYGTTGRAVPGYEIKLIGDDGQPVKKGEMGELYVRGPTSAIMYWNNREKSRSTFQGEWTRSGDKYIEDDDGYYVCCGRQRRHAESVRHVCLAVRGRGRAVLAPGCTRGCGGRLER